MAGIITINDHQRWEVSNWVYWNLMDQVLQLVKEKSSASSQFVETCKWMQGLDIPEMKVEEHEIAGEILTALKSSAQNCSQGVITAKVDGRVLDEESQRQFREATHELVTMLSACERGPSTR